MVACATSIVFARPHTEEGLSTGRSLLDFGLPCKDHPPCRPHPTCGGCKRNQCGKRFCVGQAEAVADCVAKGRKPECFTNTFTFVNGKVAVSKSVSSGRAGRSRGDAKATAVGQNTFTATDVVVKDNFASSSSTSSSTG